MSINRKMIDDHLVLENTESGESTEIWESIEDGCAFIAPKGDLTVDVTNDLEDELTSMVLTCSNMVIDMTQVHHIASSVLRMMLNIQNMVDARDGDLIIKGVRSDVMDKFEELGLDSVFDIETTDTGSNRGTG